MGGFGSKKKETKPKEPELNQTQQTVLECKLVRDKIKKDIRAAEKKANNLKQQAKEYLAAKDKDRARIYLRRSNMALKNIKGYEGALDMINDQIANIEHSQEMNAALKVLQKGNALVKQMQKESGGIDAWQKVADDLEDLKDADREVTDFLKEQGINAEEFDADIQAEMNKMMADTAGEVKLPSVPEHEKEVVTEKEAEKKQKVAVMA